MPQALNMRLSSAKSPLKDKSIVFSDVVRLADGEWNAFVGWRSNGGICMSYGHGGFSAEESITRLERDLLAKHG